MGVLGKSLTDGDHVRPTHLQPVEQDRPSPFGSYKVRVAIVEEYRVGIDTRLGQSGLSVGVETDVEGRVVVTSFFHTATEVRSGIRKIGFTPLLEVVENM
jgi:hypothetical protein